jgi:hypothetical protein
MPGKVVEEIITYLQNKINAWQIHCVDLMPLINMLLIDQVIKDLKQMRFESAIKYLNDELDSMRNLAVKNNDIFEDDLKKWMLNFLPEKLAGDDANEFESKISFWLDYLTRYKMLVAEEDENGNRNRTEIKRYFEEYLIVFADSNISISRENNDQ